MASLKAIGCCILLLQAVLSFHVHLLSLVVRAVSVRIKCVYACGCMCVCVCMCMCICVCAHVSVYLTNDIVHEPFMIFKIDPSSLLFVYGNLLAK